MTLAGAMRCILIFLYLFSVSGAVFGQDDDAASHYQQGSQLMDGGGDLDAAARHFEQAAALGFQPLGTAYRLADGKGIDAPDFTAETFETRVQDGDVQVRLP